jgi:hypothetical protein
VVPKQIQLAILVRETHRHGRAEQEPKSVAHPWYDLSISVVMASFVSFFFTLRHTHTLIHHIILRLEGKQQTSADAGIGCSVPTSVVVPERAYKVNV